jgi:cytochrome P450
MLPPPRDPLAAATHPDPYGYYADLVARTPCYHDERLGMWIAGGAAAVTAVLSSDLGHARPPAEPVPRALLGSPAATIFRNLVRMNDGDAHARMRPAVERALATLQEDSLTVRSRAWANELADESAVRADPRLITPFAFDLVAATIAELLGVSRAQLPQVAAWLGDFVLCLAANSSAAQLARAGAAAGHLLDLFRALLVSGASDGLLVRLAHEAGQEGLTDIDVIVANGIGFLSQAYEATAGLIGNTLQACATRPALREQVKAEPDLLRRVVAETARYDPPVHNTRRFLIRDGMIAGQQMRAGDAVLVVLAAANRDPAANAQPERFEPRRANRQSYTFGLGAHACVGTMLATTIASAGVAALLDAPWLDESLATRVTYRASTNLRIPIWTTAAPAAHNDIR